SFRSWLCRAISSEARVKGIVTGQPPETWPWGREAPVLLQHLIALRERIEQIVNQIVEIAPGGLASPPGDRMGADGQRGPNLTLLPLAFWSAAKAFAFERALAPLNRYCCSVPSGVVTTTMMMICTLPGRPPPPCPPGMGSCGLFGCVRDCAWRDV